MERASLTEDLRDSEARYRSLVELSPEIAYRLDPEGRIVFVSRGVEAYGYRPDELVGRSLDDLIHPRDVRRLRRRFVERRTGARVTRNLEIRLRRRPVADTNSATEYVDVLLSTRGLWDVPDERVKSSPKTFLGTQGIILDVTERKRAEKALAESERTYRRVFETAGEGILVADVETMEFRYAKPRRAGASSAHAAE
jgi:PAS domain S-box-containing protein